LEGKARMYLGEEIYTLGVQEGIEVVPGRSHRIEHAGGEELVFLLISAPRVASDDIWPT
jgi:mannose-6-phosphate isomerase-like protein (cupin superfamily)